MDANRIILIFFCGQLWRPLSTETHMPLTTSLSSLMLPSRNSPVSNDHQIRNPNAKYAHQLNTIADINNTERASASAMASQMTVEEKNEPSDGSWIAALLIGIILTGMMIAIVVILLWKCSRKPALVDPYWAGCSQLADGVTPDTFADSIKDPEWSTKRASVLSFLPWKFNKNSLLLEDTEVQLPESKGKLGKLLTNIPEKQHNPSSPTAQDGSDPLATGISVSSPNSENGPHTPVSDGLGNIQNPPIQSPDLLPESPDLPPPPNWLTDIHEDLSPKTAEHHEFKPEVPHQFPPPLDLSLQDQSEALPPPPEDLV